MNEKEVDRQLRKPNVLSWRTDLTKIKGGADVGQSCITVFVSNKLDKKKLASQDVIPPEIDGVPTDVVELKSDSFSMGKTSVGLKTPEEQKRMMGVKR